MGVDVGSFEDHFLTMHCRSGILVLFNVPVVKGDLKELIQKLQVSVVPGLCWDGHSQELCSVLP